MLELCKWIQANLNSLTNKRLAQTNFIKLLLCGLHLFAVAFLHAQSSVTEWDSLKKPAPENVKKPALESFNINGFYRFYAKHRMMPNPYMVDNVAGVPYYVQGR